MKKIILASTSPRRREMLSWLGIDYISISPEIDESLIRHSDPKQLTMLLAVAKAEAVSKLNSGSIIIGSDTVVVFEDKIIEKPLDKKHQRELIYMQKGKPAEVYSSVCIIDNQTDKKIVRTLVTKYKMTDLPDEKIETYIESGEGLDKAGGFGCQDENGMLLAEIEGCYTNLIGFPICEVASILKKLGVAINVDVKKVVREKTGREC
jgi:septum formation protein